MASAVITPSLGMLNRQTLSSSNNIASKAWPTLRASDRRARQSWPGFRGNVVGTAKCLAVEHSQAGGDQGRNHTLRCPYLQRRTQNWGPSAAAQFLSACGTSHAGTGGPDPAITNTAAKPGISPGHGAAGASPARLEPGEATIDFRNA